MRRRFSSVFGLGLALWPAAMTAQDMGETMTGTMPVYSQILAYPVPLAFEPVYEKEENGSYILEFAPKGEDFENWTQLITVTGAQDLAETSGTPLAYGSILGNQFKSACPDSFRAWDEGEMQVSGASAAQLFTFACGDLGGYSEMATILVAFGPADVFTFQWAERGEAQEKPDSDPAVWSPRAKALLELRLCEIVEGEEPPYPSCAP